MFALKTRTIVQVKSLSLWPLSMVLCFTIYLVSSMYITSYA